MAGSTHGVRGAFNSVFARPAHDTESAMAAARRSGAGKSPPYADDHRRSRQGPRRRIRPSGSRTGPARRGVGRRPRDGASCLVAEGVPGGLRGSGRARSADAATATLIAMGAARGAFGPRPAVRRSSFRRCAVAGADVLIEAVVTKPRDRTAFPAWHLQGTCIASSSRHRRARSAHSRTDTVGNRSSTLRRDRRAESSLRRICTSTTQGSHPARKFCTYPRYAPPLGRGVSDSPRGPQALV